MVDASAQLVVIGNATLLQGDCLAVLATLPDNSVHCCITSPPYFGLRDYGHPDQIGLEDSPDAYVTKMVSVFREVRRVLRDDGTCWINLGSSYAGSTMTGGNNGINASGGSNGFKQKRQFRRAASSTLNQNQSPLLWRAPACDNDDTELPDSLGFGHACHGSCDEHQDANHCRHDGIAHSALSGQQDSLPLSQTVRDNGHRDCVTTPAVVLPRGDKESTTRQSSDQLQDAFCQASLASMSPSANETSPDCAQGSERNSVCTDGTDRMLPPLAVHKKGKELFFSACRKPDCNGIGRCGYCFASLTIASLNIKAKDELNIPHLVAMALQADGWVLRQTICWAKPNPMPESVTDRCTKAHEYLFLLTKADRYWYDAEAVKEPASAPGGHTTGKKNDASRNDFASIGFIRGDGVSRNLRSVWSIASQPYDGAHFAVMPKKLVEPCILAGCPVGGTVLDPFNGAATVGIVALEHGRQYIGIELNPEYVRLSVGRLTDATRQGQLFSLPPIPRPAPSAQQIHLFEAAA